MDLIEGITSLISNLGFPIFVAVYVLLRMEPSVKSLEKTVNVLTYVLAKQTGVDIEEAKRMCGKKGER